jgi:hypothetical protein
MEDFFMSRKSKIAELTKELALYEDCTKNRVVKKYLKITTNIPWKVHIIIVMIFDLIFLWMIKHYLILQLEYTGKKYYYVKGSKK